MYAPAARDIYYNVHERLATFGDSSKPQNVSRQSSILKLPKQRQPLQCVTSDPSTLDDGPTAKIKRRVSFARNRRIKEFCNETEQETVWDNTYEEHDLSSTKSSTNSTHDQPLIITVPCYDKENFPVQLFLPTNEINCTELQSNITEEQNYPSQCNTEMEDTSDIECEKLNNDHELSDATIYCNDGMELTTLVLPNEDSCLNNGNKEENFETSKNLVFPSNINLKHDMQLDISKINTYSVATTDLLRPMIHSNNNSKERTENIFDNIEKDITETLPISRSELCLLQKEQVDRREIYTNVSMEMTEAVQCKRDYNLSEVPSSNAVIKDKMNVYCDMSMELTEAVLKPIHQKSIQPSFIPKLINKSIEPRNVHHDPAIESTEQTKIFNNSKMDITETVPISRTLQNPLLNVPPDGNKMTTNTSMELTEAVQSIRDVQLSQVPPSTSVLQDKLNKYCDSSMEMTEAVSKTSHRNLIPSLSMQKLINKSMELTEVVPSSNLNHIAINSVMEKTKIFNNSNMEITETVPVSRNQFAQIISKDKTNIYENQSMEITEAVPKRSEYNPTHRLNSKSVAQDKLNVYCDTSMEMTEAVSKPARQNLVSSSYMPKLINKSMELTEVVSCSNMNHNTISTATEKTKIFNNSNMDITETVPVSKSQFHSSQIISKDQSKIYENVSMELTEAVQKRTDNNGSQGIYSKSVAQDKLNIYCDTSMEMTEADSKSSHQNLLSSLNMPKLINKSMELTEVVPSRNHNHVAISSVTDKTKIFNNSNMNITETVPVSRNQFTQITSKDKTNIYENQSMEITEAVPKRSEYNPSHRLNSKSVAQDMLNVYCDTSMEMTEAVSKSTRQNLVSSSYMPKLINKSMELTEVVPSNNLNHNVISSKNINHGIPVQITNNTKIFNDTEMNVIETEPITRIKNQSLKEVQPVTIGSYENLFEKHCFDKVGNNLIINKSIRNDVKTDTDIEKTVSKDLSLNQIKSNSDEILSSDRSNPSSKLLISGLNTLDKSNSQFYKISSSTKVYHDDSMEMTNVILDQKTLNASNLSRLAFDTKHNKTNLDEERCNSDQKEKSFQSMYDPPKSGEEDSLEYSELPTVLTNFTKSSFQANSFQRITSDELHTLCASLNLPTQKYNREENVASQNNFFGVCNDVNILRNSLRNNTLFKSQRDMIESLSISKNEEIVSTEPSNLDKSINSRSIRNMDSEEQHLTSLQRTNLVTNMSLSEVIVNPALKSSVFRDDCDISITKTNLIGQPLISASDLQETEVINNGSTLQQTSSGLTDVFQACVKLNKKSILKENVTIPSGTSLNDFVNNKTIQNIQKIYDENEYLNTSHFTQSTSSAKRKYCDNTDGLDKSNKRCNYENSSSTEKSQQDLKKDKSCEVSLEKSQNKTLSDIMDISVTGTSFTNCTFHPEKLNDNAIEKRSEKSFSNKTLFSEIENVVLPSLEDETQVIPNSHENENLNNSSLKNIEIIACPTVDPKIPKIVIEDTSAMKENLPKIGKMNQLEHNVENKESKKINISDSNLQLNLHTEPYFQDLEDIEPPSFLNCDDSTQEDYSNRNDVSLTKNNETFSNKIISPTSTKIENHKKSLEESNVDTTHEIIVSPAMQLMNNISEQAKRDDCIWSVCKMDPHAIIIYFLSKSMVITLFLHSDLENHSEDIKNITFKSRLKENSRNNSLKIAHKLLLKKFESDDLLDKFKLYDDVLPLLDYVANEVIFVMDFIFDLEKLNSLYLMKIEIERISFKVASNKTSIILDISIPTKQINRINAEDVQVKCILGNIRIKDIKRIIENTKRDYKFLSRYIEYVQEYITLIEDSSTSSRKF
uniref:Uncharacterized protein n=1 Tax=Trichogramma kaykai TaxID=54128 RepID=A0ABD2X6H7_9HYME